MLRATFSQARLLRFVLPAAICFALAAPEPQARAQQAATDADVVTAVDVSDSIGRHEEWLQQTGLIRGLRHPAFLRAATNGRHGRIGFAVFTWSSGGDFRILVPWTVIGSAEDIARVSTAIGRATLVDRSGYGGGDMDVEAVDLPSRQRMTDISAAIDFASDMLASTPFAASRPVMNICSDGSDNFGGGPQFSRDRAVARGQTVNGLVLGSNAKLVDYFRSHVVGGSGAFVMELSATDDAGKIMAKKFALDLLGHAGPRLFELNDRGGRS